MSAFEDLPSCLATCQTRSGSFSMNSPTTIVACHRHVESGSTVSGSCQREVAVPHPSQMNLLPYASERNQPIVASRGPQLTTEISDRATLRIRVDQAINSK